MPTLQATPLAHDGEFGANLPDNFLPVALPVIQGTAIAGVYPLYRGAGMGRLTTQVIAADALLDTLGAAPQSDGPAFLGPHVATATQLSLDPASSVNIAARIKEKGKPANADIGIIDTGFAFWNPMFGTNLPAFAAMGFFGLATSADDPVATLDAAAMAEISECAREQGDAAAHRALAKSYPESVWAGRNGQSLISPDGFSHGTAMAGLSGAYAGDNTRLFGLELPAVAVTDSSGDILQGILVMAMRRLVEMILAASKTKRRIIIVIPFAFLGGPHTQDDRPSSQIAETITALSDELGVEIVVPMGNHAEDQAHAKARHGEGGMDKLNLRLPADDTSASTVELVMIGNAPTLHLTDPAGNIAEILLESGVQTLSQGNQIIGAVWTVPLGDSGMMRTRLTFGPTNAAIGHPDAAGLWVLAFKGIGAVDAWILRDEQTLRTAQTMGYRQARFEDENYVRFQPDNIHNPAPDAPKSTVRRAGSGSVLAHAVLAAGRANAVAVGATWAPHAPSSFGGLSSYSGRLDGQSETRVLVDSPRPGDGHLTIANATKRLFRVSGTSAAAAIEAGRRAHIDH